MADVPATPAASQIHAVAAGDEMSWLGIQRKWWLLAVAVPSIMLAEMAFTGLLFSNVFVLQGIDADVYSYQWATGPYIVLMVVGALLSVRFAQTFGSQRTYLAGALLAGAGCLVAAGAHSLAVMVIGRLLMSGKVLVLCVTLSQIWLAFPRRKGLAMGVYSAAMYGGLFLGVALGGFLEFQVSWRMIYAIDSTLFFALAIAGHRVFIHDRPAHPPPLKLNLTEVTLLAIALAVAVFLVFRGQYYGWLDSNLVAFTIPVAAIALAGFAWMALTESDPLVSVRLRRFPTLNLTLAVAGIMGGVGIGLMNNLPSYLNLREYPSVVEGWIVFFPGMAIAIFCVASSFAHGRTRAVVALWAGLALTLIGTLWYVEADLYTSKWTVSAMLCVWAMGVGLVSPTALQLTFEGQTPAAVQELAGVKVAVRFAATVLGAFLTALIIQRGSDIGQDLLRQDVTRNRSAYARMTPRLEQHAAARGSQPETAAQQAASIVGEWVNTNAQVTGHRAGRRFLATLTALALVLGLFVRLRPETSILAEDLDDFGWGSYAEPPPRSETALGRAA
jgi:MFS family permease